MRRLSPALLPALLVSTVLLIALTGLAGASSREVMLEDLRCPEMQQNDIYFRPDRPGPVVRVVPWLEEDGSYALLAVTAVGWVYKTAPDPSHWVLVGRIFDVGSHCSVAPLME